jgi:hypothetical protein
MLEGYQTPVIPVSFTTLQKFQAVAQYLKELSWLGEIEGHNPQTLMNLASLLTKEEPKLLHMSVYVHGYVDHMRSVVGGMEPVV